jgi:hypothetical protein
MVWPAAAAAVTDLLNLLGASGGFLFLCGFFFFTGEAVVAALPITFVDVTTLSKMRSESVMTRPIVSDIEDGRDIDQKGDVDVS